MMWSHVYHMTECTHTSLTGCNRVGSREGDRNRAISPNVRPLLQFFPSGILEITSLTPLSSAGVPNRLLMRTCVCVCVTGNSL